MQCSCAIAAAVNVHGSDSVHHLSTRNGAFTIDTGNRRPLAGSILPHSGAMSGRVDNTFTGPAR